MYLCICSISLYISHLQLLPPFSSLLEDPLHPTSCDTCFQAYSYTCFNATCWAVLFFLTSSSDTLWSLPPMWISCDFGYSAWSNSKVDNFLTSFRTSQRNTTSLTSLCLPSIWDSRLLPSALSSAFSDYNILCQATPWWTCPSCFAWALPLHVVTRALLLALRGCLSYPSESNTSRWAALAFIFHIHMAVYLT